MEGFIKDQTKRFREAIGKPGLGVVYAKQLRQQITEGIVTHRHLTKEELLDCLATAEANFLNDKATKKTRERIAWQEKQQRWAAVIEERSNGGANI